jgi:hypothetical protein
VADLQKLLKQRDPETKTQTGLLATDTPTSKQPTPLPRKNLAPVLPHPLPHHTPYETVNLQPRAKPRKSIPGHTMMCTPPPSPPAPSPPALSPLAQQPTQLKVQCCSKSKRPPRCMHRGSVATDGKSAYFTPCDSTSLYKYRFDTEQWTELLSCLYQNSGLVVLNNQEPTAVGGRDASVPTNKLLTLRQNKLLSETYPQMGTARSNPAVVSTSDCSHVTVIGGCINIDNWTTTVEILQVKSRTWYEVANMPGPLPSPSATICGDRLHVIGSDTNGYSCSLQELLLRCKPISHPVHSISPKCTCRTLPTLPQMESTAATLCGELIVIGGGFGESPVNFIHQLVGQKWVEIGCLATGRRKCLVANESPEKIFIVGGILEDSVEECTVFDATAFI